MSERSKVGVLFIQSQLAAGADSVVHFELMRHLDRTKFEVHVACAAGSEDAAPPSLAAVQQIPDVHVRPTRFIPGLSHRNLAALAFGIRTSLPFPIEFARLVQYARKHNVRIIHATEKPRDALNAVVLAKLVGAKSVVHVHVKWSDEYSALARWAVRSSHAVFAISRYVEDTIVRMGTPAERVHTILNCLDTSRWDPSIDGSHVRREFGVAEDEPLLVSVSRLFSWKGQRELIQALAIVRQQIPNARLLIVGADETFVHGGSFTQELKELCRSLGVEDRVTFTGARSDVPAVMAAADVYAMPSFEEPFGIVFLEAMAMKRPIAAVDNGGTPEVVEHGRAGLLSPPWDVEKLAANLVKLLADRSLRERMGEFGRQRVLDYFNPVRAAREAGEAYHRILAN